MTTSYAAMIPTCADGIGLGLTMAPLAAAGEQYFHLLKIAALHRLWSSFFRLLGMTGECLYDLPTERNGSIT